jgi:divalent metal cation (Fe/Co/Zn/Cd) transporter
VTGSPALLAFGLDSVVDGPASAARVWRFRLELRPAGRPVHAERTAARIVAAAMLAAAVYVVSQEARALITGVHPGCSVTGIALLAGSLVALPVLGSIKLQLVGQLRSRALRGEHQQRLGRPRHAALRHGPVKPVMALIWLSARVSTNIPVAWATGACRSRA